MSLKDFGFFKSNINEEQSEEQSEEQYIKNEDYLNIYTDGACFNNGKSNAKAGLGVYIPEYDLKISERVKGKQSNNTAELKALIKAHECILEKDKKRLIRIYSDSEYSIKCATSYGRKLEAQNWTSKTKKIPNLNLVKEVYYLYKPYKNISFIHIYSHTQLNDVHSKGNEMADQLAKSSLGTYHPSKKKNKTRIYFNVSFSQKDEFKSYGGLWDKQKKSWYIYDDNQYLDLLKTKF